MNRLLLLFSVLTAGLLLTGCGKKQTPAAVNGYMSGTLTLSAEGDSLADHSGFEVLVAANTEGDIDTLAFAVTDPDGHFEAPVGAPEKGLYPLVISRGGQTLTIAEIVVADGDSARITARFPLDGRLVRVVSAENAAWSAYKNTKAQYNRSVLALTGAEGGYSEESMSREIRRTAAIYWGLETTFPGTMGATVAAAEATVMLEGWDDSLAVAHAREIAPTHPSKVSIIRAVRRSVARMEGQRAALSFVRSFVPGSTPQQGGALLAEVVLAHMDSLEFAQAVQVAREMQASYPDSEWSRWAEGAIYEVQNLQPGMPAPDFSLVDVNGTPIDKESLRDQFYMLEFFTPTHPAFQQELGLRRAMLGAVSPDVFEAVSISLAPDSAYTEALLDGRDLAGRFVIEPDGMESLVATAYNVNVIPTRILIDPSGLIVGKFVGARLQDLDGAIAARLAAIAAQ